MVLNQPERPALTRQPYQNRRVAAHRASRWTFRSCSSSVLAVRRRPHPRAAGPLVEAQAGRGLLQQRCQSGLASVERLAPQVAAVELDHFGSLSLIVRVEPPIVRVGQGLLRLAALVPSGSIGVRLAVVGTGYPVERAVVSIF